MLTAPACAAVEVALAAREVWLSPVPRPTALLVAAAAAALFPLWYLAFLVILLAGVWDAAPAMVSRRTKLIVYDARPSVSAAAAAPAPAPLRLLMVLLGWPVQAAVVVDKWVAAARAADAATAAASNPAPPHPYFALAKQGFYVLTAPVWVLCVVVARAVDVVAYVRGPPAAPAHDAGGAAGGGDDLGGYPDTDAENDDYDGEGMDGGGTPPGAAAAPAPHAGASAGAGGATGAGGLLHLSFLRLRLTEAKVGFLGRKPNVFVRVLYGTHVEVASHPLPLFSPLAYPVSLSRPIELCFHRIAHSLPRRSLSSAGGGTGRRGR